MTFGVEQHEPRRLLVALVLAVLAVAVGFGLGVDAHASSSGDQVGGTRVAAHELAVGPVVAAAEDVLAGEGRRTTTHAAEDAVGSRVAPRATPSPPSRTIVIGEDMEGRVIPYAERIGADYYNPPPAPRSQWMENNRRWINDRMDEGCTIIDCGPAPGRPNYPNPSSPYYQMELGEIAKREYPTSRVDPGL